jgi:hypothetical protein
MNKNNPCYFELQKKRLYLEVVLLILSLIVIGITIGAVISNWYIDRTYDHYTFGTMPVDENNLYVIEDNVKYLHDGIILTPDNIALTFEVTGYNCIPTKDMVKVLAYNKRIHTDNGIYNNIIIRRVMEGC